MWLHFGRGEADLSGCGEWERGLWTQGKCSTMGGTRLIICCVKLPNPLEIKRAGLTPESLWQIKALSHSFLPGVHPSFPWSSCASHHEPVMAAHQSKPLLDRQLKKITAVFSAFLTQSHTATSKRRRLKGWDLKGDCLEADRWLIHTMAPNDGLAHPLTQWRSLSEVVPHRHLCYRTG